MSVSEQDLAFIDRYVATHDVPSRSAAVQRAIALLRMNELADAYVDAWQEWADTGEAQAWESVVGDGLKSPADHASR